MIKTEYKGYSIETKDDKSYIYKGGSLHGIATQSKDKSSLEVAKHRADTGTVTITDVINATSANYYANNDPK